MNDAALPVSSIPPDQHRALVWVTVLPDILLHAMIWFYTNKSLYRYLLWPYGPTLATHPTHNPQNAAILTTTISYATIPTMAGISQVLVCLESARGILTPRTLSTPTT